MINQRQTEIFEELKKCKRMSVNEISKKFFVSEMTVRRDLKIMEDEGYIYRYKGGAVFYQSENMYPINMRKLLHTEQKKKLSQIASKYIHDSMNVFIDSSSTCMYIIPYLAKYNDIHIITNSVQNLLVAAEHNIHSTICGGNYYAHDMCIVGSSTDEFVHNINTNIAFFSSLGIDDDGIISDKDEKQNSVRKIVMKNCPCNVFLLDSNKQHKKYLYTLCTSQDATDVIIL